MIELGPGASAPWSRRSRRLARVVVAAVLVGAGLLTAAQQHDVRQTLTQEQFLDAFATFRPGVRSSDIDLLGGEELAAAAVVTDPAQCHLVLDQNPPGAIGGASWSPSGDAEDGTANVQASRFADPAAARRAFAAVRRAARSCAHATVPASPDQDAASFGVADVGTDTRLRPRRLHYTLQIDDQASDQVTPNRAEFPVDVLVYGNVLAWTFDTSDDGAPAHPLTEVLADRMRALTR